MRFLFRHGLNLRRVEIGEGTAPSLPPLNIVHSATPTGTAEAGDVYPDSTLGNLQHHNGTSYAPIGGRIPPVTAAATLTSKQSGATCFFTTAAGYTFTLPTAAPGLRFRFVVLTTITSVAAKVITASASEFLLGSFIQSTDGTYTSAERLADGTTIRAWSGNGTTTGGLTGDWFEVVAISATQWAISGMGRATGSEATPFATS